MIWLLLLAPLALWEVYRESRRAATRRAAVRRKRQLLALGSQGQLASEAEAYLASITKPNTEK